MVDTLTLVLAGVLLYTLIALVAKNRGLIPDYIRVQGPITTVHTERGKEFLDWLATPKRAWRAWGNFGIGVALVVMVGSFLLVLFAGVQALLNPQVTQTPLSQPRNVLAIPGVNDFLPLSAAVEIVGGLLIGLVVHEGGHGLLCRVEDIDIDSMGVALLAVIPIGAFVEPDEASRDRADRGSQTRMFAAGVTNNFAVAAIAFALLFGPVVGSIAVAPGIPIAGVLPGSAAAQAGIDRGDVITEVNGTQVTNQSELDAALATMGRTVEVSLRSGETVSVTRSLIVTGAVKNAPLDVNSTVVAVNGTTVHTEEAFYAAIADRPVATLTTAEGREVTAPMGAYGVVLGPDSPTPTPLYNASAPAGEPIIITAVEGERTANRSALSAALADTKPGQTIEVVAYVNGSRNVYDVTLARPPGGGDSGFLGIGALQPGTSGMTIDDFGIDTYPANLFLGALGGDGGFGIDSFVLRAYLVLTLPFAKFSLGVGHNFPGFVGVYQNFYVASGGPLSFLGDAALLFLGSLLFWTAWINVIIGQFNCIPAFPLDGGHILRTSTEAVVSRLPVESDYAITRAVTTTIGVTMLVSLLLMIFGGEIIRALS